MDETQKDNNDFLLDKIERLLKETKKKKRDLAKALKISENSINRTLKNSNISYSKLKIVAKFFGIDIIDLLSQKEIETIQEIDGGYKHTNSLDNTNQLTLNSLSLALERSTKTIDSLVQIISEYFQRNFSCRENFQILFESTCQSLSCFVLTPWKDY